MLYCKKEGRCSNAEALQSQKNRRSESDASLFPTGVTLLIFTLYKSKSEKKNTTTTTKPKARKTDL